MKIDGVSVYIRSPLGLALRSIHMQSVPHGLLLK